MKDNVTLPKMIAEAKARLEIIKINTLMFQQAVDKFNKLKMKNSL